MASPKTPKQIDIKVRSLKRQITLLEKRKKRVSAAKKKKPAKKKKVAKKRKPAKKKKRR